MDFSRYRHCAKAISDILQDTWKEMTILSFCCECLDVRFVILGKGNPNRMRLRIDGDAVRARGARERRQRRECMISCNYIWNGYAGAACHLALLTSGGTSRVFLRAPRGPWRKSVRRQGSTIKTSDNWKTRPETIAIANGFNIDEP
jgi:hypothetical protein